MKYTAITSLLVAIVAAETVNELVDQIPTCAVNCIRDAAQSVNCDITNFACSCSKITQLTPNVVSCLATSGCSSADQAKVFQLTPQICAQVSESDSQVTGAAANPTATEGGAAAATAADAVTSTTAPAAAGRVQAAGWAGVIAAAAAFAL